MRLELPMSEPRDRWADTNAAWLAARGLETLPPGEARALLALLHSGTLVEHSNTAALRALDLQRLAWFRALAGGTLSPDEADRAAIGLLALGHRDPARERRASSPVLALAWGDWVGEGEGGADPRSALVVEGLGVAPAADRGELHLTVGDAVSELIALRRLRVGGTVLDVELRRRPAGLLLRIARTHGPSLVVTLALPSKFALVTVDDVEGLALPLRFEARDRHEVVAYG
jgi:hypothetical protein